MDWWSLLPRPSPTWQLVQADMSVTKAKSSMLSPLVGSSTICESRLSSVMVMKVLSSWLFPVFVCHSILRKLKSQRTKQFSLSIRLKDSSILCRMSSWSQVSAFQHYSNLPLASSLSQSLYSSPQALPPSFGSNPSSLPATTLCPRLPHPPSPLHPGPGLLDPSSDTPCQPHLPFRFPVHRLHWSRHSLSPPCPFRPSSIFQTSVGPSAFCTPHALN